MVYALDSEKKTFQKVLSDKGRGIDLEEKIDDSFIIIPSDLTSKETNAIYFLTDRGHAPSSAYDLYRKTNVNSSEELVCENISSPNLFFIKNKLCFMKGNDDANTFDLCELSTDGYKSVKTFSGSPNQYVFRDNYMFNPSSKTLYNLESLKSKNLNSTLSISAVQDFAVNSDGTKLALAGNFAGNSEKLLFIDFKKNRFNILDSDNLFISDFSNIRFLGSSVFLVAPNDSKDKVSNMVFSWDAIFSFH